MIPDWRVAWSRIIARTRYVREELSKIDSLVHQLLLPAADSSRESGTRARVDGRSSDCRRSERRRTADRWWVESESTDLPDSCEPTKPRSLVTGSLLSRDPAVSDSTATAVLAGRDHDLGGTRCIPPRACTCWTTITIRRTTGRFHRGSTNWTRLASLSQYITRAAPPLSLSLLSLFFSYSRDQCSNCAEIRASAKRRPQRTKERRYSS